MGTKPINTKELLIITAGILFAEFGFDGVSTRMIADKAEVKLSSIHYHFGSKLNLYVEAFTYANEKGKCTNFADVIAENPTLIETTKGQAEIIKNTVFRTFHDYFKPDRPEWETQILIREIANPTSAMNTVTEKVFKPDADSAKGFYKTVRPQASDEEAAAWSDLLHGHILLYSMARKPLEIVRGEDALRPEFFQITARILARAMILEADLPLPDDLK